MCITVTIVGYNSEQGESVQNNMHAVSTDVAKKQNDIIL